MLEFHLQASRLKDVKTILCGTLCILSYLLEDGPLRSKNVAKLKLQYSLVLLVAIYVYVPLYKTG
jgi:hypothetical protein